MSWNREFDHAGESLRVSANRAGGTTCEVLVGERRYEVDSSVLANGCIAITVDGKRYVATAVRLDGGSVQVRVGGRTFTLPVRSGGRGGGGDAATGDVKAPMTGTILEIKVAVGDEVSAGDTVAVVTAMKMEHKLTAGVDGKVVEVHGEPSANVDEGALIVRIE